MNKTPVVLTLGLGLAGLFVGFAGNRLIGERPSAEQAPAPVAGSARNAATRGVGEAAPRGARFLPKPGRIASSDTLESLAMADAGTLYGRLAAWLMEASEADVAAYWEMVKDQPRTNDITDLVFIHWTRLNPQAAIAAVAGTGVEHYAWWAWSCHDPQGALAAAIAAGPDRVNNVAWGIGEFHPAWLMEHFDEIPASGRGNAISGLTKWDDTDQPLEILNFLKAHGGEFRPRIFSALIRKDPWAAYDWMRENMDVVRRNYGSEEGAMRALIDTMAKSQPEALERLASQTPSGQLKRQMEAAVFDNLLKTDPAAALAQATATKAPAIATQRLAAVGLHQLKTDPEQAFAIAKTLFSNHPGALYTRTEMVGPEGSMREEISGNSAVNAFVDALMARDPAQVMAMQTPSISARESDYMEFGDKWARMDLAAYSEWVKQQSDPAVRNAAVVPMVREMMESDRYAEAAEWSLQSDRLKGSLEGVLGRWARDAPEEARQWLQSANLPAGDKARLESTLKDIR